MSDALKKCHAEETAACCCVDVGAVIDNSDCNATYQHHFATEAEAEQMLLFLTAKARQVESEPCQIDSQLKSDENGVTLLASFNFSCQTETLIFQLAFR